MGPSGDILNLSMGFEMTDNVISLLTFSLILCGCSPHTLTGNWNEPAYKHTNMPNDYERKPVGRFIDRGRREDFGYFPTYYEGEGAR